jgi:lysozyme family protein
MSHFSLSFSRVVGVEGKYSNNPDDSGGETMYGITAAVARAHGYTGPMHQMPLDVAQRIYRADYWDALNLDGVAGISPAVADELFDTAVNCGAVIAGEFLQRALNAFNQRATLYPDVKVDGRIGPKTVDALRRFMAHRGRAGETVMMRALNALQGARYVRLAEIREKDETFVFGWMLNRVVIA